VTKGLIIFIGDSPINQKKYFRCSSLACYKRRKFSGNRKRVSTWNSSV